MLRWAIALALLFGLAMQAKGQELQRTCENRYVFSHAVATGPITVVAGEAAKRVYFCGFIIAQASQSLGFQVTMGKGTNCATGTVPLTPMFETPSNFAMSTRIPATPPAPGSEGMSLCIQTSGTGKLSGILFYSLF